MPLKSKPSPAEGEFLFEIDEEPTEECLTALGGVPLFVRTARSLDVPGSVKRNLALKQGDRGFDEATYIESFLVLNAAGGDCLEDFDCLREDRGLAAMLGHEVPARKRRGNSCIRFTTRRRSSRHNGNCRQEISVTCRKKARRCAD
jgi:hypothetical protein